MSFRNVIFNGKFMSASPTGVHRVAEELLRHIDRLIESRPQERRWEVIAPRDAKRQLPLSNMTTRNSSVLTWQLWEQFELPLRAQDGLLVNLCNLAPLSSRRSITMIHDAQVFISPESYSTAFRQWYQFALPRIGKGAEKIITVSDYSKSQLVKYGIADAAQICTIHNGIDHLPDQPAPESYLTSLGLSGQPYVVALANTQKHKNVATVIRAFERQDLRRVKLVLVGSHVAADFEAAGLTPGDNIQFVGRVSDAELLRLYLGAACLAFPSLTEGFGLPPLEAMRAGCPAIVAPNGALPEVCAAAAIYADSSDPSAWAAKIIELVENPGMRQQVGAAGMRHAARFTWTAAAEKLLDVINQSLHN